MPLERRGAAPENGCNVIHHGSEIMVFTSVMLIHLAAAALALILGGLLLLMQRGTPQHRFAGRVWVALMALTALSSFFIRTSGGYSWIHLLSIVMLVTLTMAVITIRQRKVARHQRLMLSAYSSLVIAGLFTLLPGRRLGYLLWHALHLV
jgi:uncharacterized membrane protein